METNRSGLDLALEIARSVSDKGGAVYYVGGFVRDRLSGRETKDVDIEVHGIYPRELEELLDALGERISIGESFGIYALKGCDLDIAMPRSEKNRGAGHRDFDVCVDPFVGTLKAAERRDFTINALMQDVLTGKLIDHFGGAEDLKNGILRHVNDSSFAEDPLRVLRAAQFAARFDFTVAEETIKLCAGMDLSALPRERVMGEIKKALLQAEKPSVFFETLRKMDRLGTWFPELEATIGIKQDPAHHAEGDVWTHTMMVLDAAAGFRERSADPLGFMFSALTHDLGKTVCTQTINGKIHSYGHEKLGLPFAETFIKRLTSEKELIKYVLNLTEMHMKPNMLAAAGSSVKATNRMFDCSVDPEGLIMLSVADSLGMISSYGYVSYEDLLFERLAIYRDYMSRPYVKGSDLIEAGLRPDERFSEYLGYAHKLRLAGVGKDSALRQTLALARKNSPS